MFEDLAEELQIQKIEDNDQSGEVNLVFSSQQSD
jgi:hypothetical protein